MVMCLHALREYIYGWRRFIGSNVGCDEIVAIPVDFLGGSLLK